MTALLILLFGIHPMTAVGTDLLFAAVTKSTGAAVHSGNGNVDWRIVIRLATGSVPATVLVLWLLSGGPLHDVTFARSISFAIGIALTLAAVGLLLRRPLQDYARRRSSSQSSAISMAMTVALGAMLGCVVTMTSVGAGAFGLAILFFLYPHCSPVRLVGTDIAHAVPLTFIAGLGHWLIGSVDWSLLVALLVGSVPGVMVGSHLAHRVPERVLLPLLASLLLIIGGRLMLG